MHDPADYFRDPKKPSHRQYEALRLYFLEEASAAEVAHRFGYSPGYVRVLGTQFRQGLLGEFFSDRPLYRDKSITDKDLQEAIIELRKQRLSIYDIAKHMTEHDRSISHQTVWLILKEIGEERLPKRTAKQHETIPIIHPPTADVNNLDLTSGRVVDCRAPLLFLFAPLLASMEFDWLVKKARYPGTSMIPPSSYLRSLLILKLISKDRKTHVTSIADDEGFGLFAGLNVLPKKTSLSDYSYRIGPTPHRVLLRKIVDIRDRMKAYPSDSFNLDFHTIRHYGDSENSILEKDYVPRRSQSVKAVVTAFAQEQDSREMVYTNANILKREKADEVIRFVNFWKETTGRKPEELVFDLGMTTHAGLAKLRWRKITFITIRERHANEIQRVLSTPDDSWVRVKLDIEDRKWKTPWVLDEMIKLTNYPGKIRQIAATDLGREEPTFLLTNDTYRGPAALLTRYARRALIENSIGEQVHFFHVDALSSDVRINVDMDVVLSVIASGCYRWFANQLKGFEKATAKRIWNTFLDRPGKVKLMDNDVVLSIRRFSKAPVLLESKLSRDQTQIPWLGNRKVKIEIT